MAIVKYAMKFLDIPNYLGEWSQLVFFILALPPTLIVSYLSKKFIEDKFTNALRHRFKIKAHKSAPSLGGNHDI